MNPITPAESVAIAGMLLSSWPQPELDQAGTDGLAESIWETKLPYDVLDDAVRTLPRTHTGQFRPTLGCEILPLARAVLAKERQAYEPKALPAEEASRLRQKAKHLANLAELTLEARDARARYAEQLGMRVEATESGTMRHISSMLRIGPTTITGAQPHADNLAAELIRRADLAEADL